MYFDFFIHIFSSTFRRDFFLDVPMMCFWNKLQTCYKTTLQDNVTWIQKPAGELQDTSAFARFQIVDAIRVADESVTPLQICRRGGYGVMAADVCWVAVTSLCEQSKVRPTVSCFCLR